MNAFFAVALLVLSSPAQVPKTVLPTQAEIDQAIIGDWVGVLEYRDYSEPAASLKRVKLPTWLTIRPGPAGVLLDTTYDDGPSKVLLEHEVLTIDPGGPTYRLASTAGAPAVYTIAGLQGLQAGRGVLVLTGPGIDKNRPAEIRTTWTIRRNLLSWLEEVRAARSSESFVFRHQSTFTRSIAPPVSTSVSPK